MAYRQTPLVRARLAAAKEALVTATVELVAAHGWRTATVQSVARRAGVATGTVYRHFAGRDDLLAEAFRSAAAHELELVAAAAAAPGTAAARLEAALRVFASRALRGRRLAYALLAEPAAPSVEAERLAYRRGYRALFSRVVADGVAAGELEGCDREVVAAALTGALGEALVGPLAPAGRPDAPERVLDEAIACCLRLLPRRIP